jgi:endonuclease/exonuclease/phosphatase family metal-dependent hydrolase
MWVFSEVRNALFPFIILLLGYPQVRSTYAISIGSSDSTDLKVMSYNVKSFGRAIETQKNMTAVTSLVQEEQPDLICFQEFGQNTGRLNGSIASFKNLGYSNYHFKDYQGRTGNSIMGVILFSKYPIVNWGDVEGGESANQTIFVEVKMASQDTIRVYCSHLSSIGLDKHVRLKPQNDDSYTKMLEQLSVAAEDRGQQIEPILTHLEDCERPFVFASDLNDLPYSYVYSSLRNIGKNSFETIGSGFDFTFNPIDQSSHMQYLRIDNQFYGNGLHCSGHKVIRDIKTLDHFPIIATYHF